GLTSSDKVASGFFRNHLYVTLGLTTLAALVATKTSSSVAWTASATALLSYAGAVCWLYEAKSAGKAMLWAVAAASWLAAWLGVTNQPYAAIPVTTSGLLLGFTFAAMLLGHWSLNSPGMELAPLQRLLQLTAAAVGLQALVGAIAIAPALQLTAEATASW